MLEFLKNVSNGDLYPIATDIEKSLRLHNNATPMATFFEITLKELIFNYKGIYNDSDRKKYKLVRILDDNEFCSYLMRNFSVTKKDLETIDTIRLSSNNLKHQSGSTELDDDKLEQCFRCVYKFASSLYEKETGDNAPKWSNKEYQSLLSKAQNDSQREKIIDKQNTVIQNLVSEKQEILDKCLIAENKVTQLQNSLEKTKEQEEFLAIALRDKKNLEKRLEELDAKLKYAYSQISAVTTINDNKNNSFKELALDATARYLENKEKVGNYDSNKCQIIKITRDTDQISRIIYILTTATNVYSLDWAKISINGRIYEQGEIKILLYDKKSHQLRVAVSVGMDDPFKGVSPKEVYIVSDDSFLIERIQSWYQKNGHLVKIPSINPNVSLGNFNNLKTKPSEDQVHAINGVLTHPFSYVWGAPGTGKTQFVLSRAILSYIQAGKKVLVIAPTNNAVEQTLNGLIKVLDEAQIDYSNLMIRYGIPTSEFAEKYPQLCEDIGLKKAITNLAEQIEYTRCDLDECEAILKLYPEYVTYMGIKNNISNLNDTFLFYADEVKIKVSGYSDKTMVLDEYESIIKTANSKLKQLLKNKEKQTKKADKISRKKENNSILKTLHITSNEKYEEQLLTVTKIICDFEKDIDTVHTDIEANEKLKNIISNEIENIVSDIRDISTKIELAVGKDDNCHVSFNNVGVDSIQKRMDELNKYIENTNDWIEQNKVKFEKIDDRSEAFFKRRRNELTNYLNELERRKEAIEANSSQCAYGKRLVVAGTVDNVIKNIDPIENSFAHIFLDEAGYCSLIKGAVLTAYNCPVTLLGDHMQLPPVSTMPELTLFSQSALYIEDSINANIKTIDEIYKNGEEPSFNKMVRYRLTNTHRFGKKLASVLGDYVYGDTFNGDKSKNTKITYIDAPKKYGNQGRISVAEEEKLRISIAEVEAINRYLSMHKNENQSVGILVPYKKGQLNKLKIVAENNGLTKDSVMNIHQCQGKEWDTVIISVVDQIGPWFTDSNNKKSKGMQILNTAISRAKNKLIIACDYDAWRAKEGQLISRLLEIAEEESLK